MSLLSKVRAVHGVAFAIIIWLCTVVGTSVVMVTPLLLVWPFSARLYNKVLLSYAGWWCACARCAQSGAGRRCVRGASGGG